jgi:hypothetical protein
MLMKPKHYFTSISPLLSGPRDSVVFGGRVLPGPDIVLLLFRKRHDENYEELV